jgi:hypothetical protein
MKTIQRNIKNLARRGFFIIREAHNLPNLIAVTCPYNYMPLLLRAHFASGQLASVERPDFIERVQTVSMLPRHEVSFTVLENPGKVCHTPSP